jgi:hypothetical protein
VHIYFLQSDEEELQFANRLWERIRRECASHPYQIMQVPSSHTYLVPELRIYKVWDRPIGPHPMPMFEVNLFTPGMQLSTALDTSYTD